jgi:aryl-alcohol dehydrogenase-like predicted oxidoreductase
VYQIISVKALSLDMPRGIQDLFIHLWFSYFEKIILHRRIFVTSNKNYFADCILNVDYSQNCKLKPPLLCFQNYYYLETVKNDNIMTKLNRRQFLQTGIAGMAGVSVLGAGISQMSFNLPANVVVDKVKLGNSGLMVPRIMMGTGSHGGGRASNQTRLGVEGFVKLSRYGHERGIKMFDSADSYGSHPFVKAALKEIPRDETQILTKMWVTENSWNKVQPVPEVLDRFRMETGSDYFDIVLMHCLMKGNWKEERKSYVDGLYKAKQDGHIKAIGVSCHNWDAMAEAVEDPWVDVILARINPFGTHLDGTPEAVMGLLEKARKNGKGIIGMKIFGNGDNVTEEERERSIKYAVSSENIHCMTLGLENPAQMDDAVARVMRNVKS